MSVYIRSDRDPHAVCHVREGVLTGGPPPQSHLPLRLQLLSRLACLLAQYIFWFSVHVVQQEAQARQGPQRGGGDGGRTNHHRTVMSAAAALRS